MPAATATATAAPVNMQGIAVPASQVQPQQFFAKTRRHTQQEATRPYTLGSSTQDVVELRKSDILATIKINFTGSLVVTPGTGTVASTARWPYDMLQSVRYTANNASNLINCSGSQLKVREQMKNVELTDRGITQTIGGVQVNQGTLSMSSESWGVGSNTTALASGTYPVQLQWIVPVAEDEVDLSGATFLATSTADLTLTMVYEQLANLFTVTGNATVALTGNFTIKTTKFSIPLDSATGDIIVPDLSMFHTLIGSQTSAIANGDNEVRIVGQGAGKSLLRLYYQLWNGAAAAAAPLAANATNFGPQGWRYGTNETPDLYADGQDMREVNERQFGTDIGRVWAFLCHDFASQLEFRDVVQMGETGELRLYSNIPSGVALTSPSLRYVTEAVYGSGTAA